MCFNIVKRRMCFFLYINMLNTFNTGLGNLTMTLIENILYLHTLWIRMRVFGLLFPRCFSFTLCFGNHVEGVELKGHLTCQKCAILIPQTKTSETRKKTSETQNKTMTLTMT